ANPGQELSAFSSFQDKKPSQHLQDLRVDHLSPNAPVNELTLDATVLLEDCPQNKSEALLRGEGRSVQVSSSKINISREELDLELRKVNTVGVADDILSRQEDPLICELESRPVSPNACLFSLPPSSKEAKIGAEVEQEHGPERDGAFFHRSGSSKQEVVAIGPSAQPGATSSERQPGAITTDSFISEQTVVAAVVSDVSGVSPVKVSGTGDSGSTADDG
ncbi:unnamed protein product, partial [Amoebophrya sp. A25]